MTIIYCGSWTPQQAMIFDIDPETCPGIAGDGPQLSDLSLKKWMLGTRCPSFSTSLGPSKNHSILAEIDTFNKMLTPQVCINITVLDGMIRD